MNSLEKPYTSNDLFVWSEEDPDLELVEPKILVSINRNYLKFGRKIGRPSLNHTIRIVNHGEHPVAFKVQTTDNYAYFVNKTANIPPFPVYGVISGRRLHCLPHVRLPNSEELIISRRPYDTFSEEQQRNYFNTPKKNTLFIFLAPVFSFTSPPAAAFHNGAAYEKLRVCLDYTGAPSTPEDISLMHRKAKGWCTWEISKEEMAEHVKLHPPKLINHSAESKMQASRDQLPITQECDASQKSRRCQDHAEAAGNMSQKSRTFHKVLQLRTGADAKGALPKAKEDSGERKSRKSDRTQSAESSTKKREGNSRSESKKPKSKSASRKDKQCGSKRADGFYKTDRTMVATMKAKKTTKE